MSGSASQVGQGALGGAMTGATVGSAIPGVGTAIGAVGGAIVGGALSYFGSDNPSDQLKDQANAYANMPTPTANKADYSGFRTSQAGLISQLQAMARGEGPSAAALQMRQAMDQAASAQSSGAAGAGGRGVNQGAAMRNAMNNTAAVQTQGAANTGIIRAQEQANAVNQLGQTITSARGADEQMSEFNAGQQNQMILSKMGISTNAQLQTFLAAMQAQGPGTGTQLLAGGASALPSMLNSNRGQTGTGYNDPNFTDSNGTYTGNPAAGYQDLSGN